jgi:protein-tyrosine-phosphatase
MAKGLYGLLSHSQDADSAGTEVNKDGQLLKDRAAEPGSEVGKVITIMAELGVDVSNYRRTLLKPTDLEHYDRIVAIMKPETIPDYLKENPKVEVWDIEDPKSKDEAGVRETRDVIKAKIIEMLG